MSIISPNCGGKRTIFVSPKLGLMRYTAERVLEERISMANVRPAFVVLGTVLMASCTAAPYDRAPGQGAQRELAEALAGRTPGPAQRCISNFELRSMQVIDDNIILFRKGGTVYIQRPRNGCPGIASGSRTLVTRPLGSQLCAGDLNYTVDLSSGIRGPACVFGPFVPYTRR
jgi:hypothetical protein